MKYLSPEWLAATQAAADRGDAGAPADGTAVLTVQQVVTDGPDGDVVYHVVVGGGRVHVHGGEAAEPTVTFSQDYETAAAVARGELSAQGAFMVGRIRMRGDLRAIVANQDMLAGVEAVFAGVRTQTEY